jgi:putative Holliday junction resolvase
MRHRLLGIDPGSRRTGIALSDELGMLAHPQPALTMPAERAIAEVARLARDEDVSEVIVGLPLTLAGGDSAQTREARAFAAALRGVLAVPVREWDERLSSVEAASRLRGQRDRRDGTRDSVAAALILQAVLDSRRSRPA